MLGCPAHAVLISALPYAGISVVRTASFIRYVHTGYIRGRGTYLMYPLERVPTRRVVWFGGVLYGGAVAGTLPEMW